LIQTTKEAKVEKTIVVGQIRECCKNLDNREEQPSNKPELIIEMCRVCKRKHYRLMAKEAFFGADVKPIGFNGS
jgi:hypothetical protein